MTKIYLYLELEAATSTTQSETSATRTSSNEPAEWTIEDVIHYIAITDPALGQHADLFRKHVSQIKTFSVAFTSARYIIGSYFLYYLYR